MGLILQFLLLLLLVTYGAAFAPNVSPRVRPYTKNPFVGQTTTPIPPRAVISLKSNIFDQINIFRDIGQASATPKVKLPDDFVVPEPKPLTISESTDLFRFAKNTLALALRLATGTFVLGWKIDTLSYDPEKADSDKQYCLRLGPLAIRDSSSVLQNAPRPQQPLVLYEYDASPYCKRVRETINLLDLTVEYRPCPGARQGKFSEELFQKTGRRTVPYLFDPNTNVGLFESSDQIEYLLTTYGPPKEDFDRKALWPITFEAFSLFTATQVAILLGIPGGKRQPNARQDNEEMKPLELWGYETSPFVRPVREKLASLCLPHIMVSCARGSANRDKMVEKMGRFQVPLLVDPNTGIEMFESAEIEKYLEDVYTI
ncbi:iron hydrogenase [Nitzschia inconspicua]|uniref:Iron hydrogenase n=1 Tax=Nitzschia inconspicua TaxID=303405 RepID=A0A9K3KMK7_9STRA|nr:iron hydrogenase [Nitzschia inconspicua]